MAHLQYMPGDPRLVDQLVYELKSKGIFDQFRKECIADVDTRPAYQNLRQRVESSVSTFLSRQCWKPDLNKNQLREKLRKHILDGNYLEQGVERIVDQVVNPKVASVFIPQVEDLVYNYLGITRKKTPVENADKPVDLLPTDLEAVSPGSVKSNEDDDFKMDIEDSMDKMEVDKENRQEETDTKILNGEKKNEQVVEIQSSNESDGSMDKSTIPLPSEEIKLENIPAPENSPPKAGPVELEKIALPREPPTNIPFAEDFVQSDSNFKPIHSEDSNSSSNSSIRRNMSPLTPIRNYNNENSCDAQQAFDNETETKENKTEPSSFRFTIESNETKIESPEKKEPEQTDLAYQFNNQVNINVFNTPLYDDSSNSNNLRIDYESDTNSKATTEKPETENVDDSKKEKKEDKKSHKSSHRSRDSSRYSSSKDKRSDSKHSRSRDSSRHDKKSSRDDHKKSSKERERSKDRSDKKDNRESSKNRSSKSSSHRDSKSHRSSSSSHRQSSKSDDRKSSSSSSHRDKDKSSKDRSKDSRSSSHRSEKDRKSSSSKKSDEKDKKKDKKDIDDHYSSSGRGNHSRRSTDRDSNDGSSSSKGSHNQNGSKTTDSKKGSKSSSSKSDNTSPTSDSTSPSDKEQKLQDTTKVSQFKPAVRVDNHLETPIANPPRLPFVPDITLKKPKFAENLQEAKTMMKMRKFLDEEQKRMNQEAALLLEFQANVRPSLSQVYSSIPGPELEFACGANTIINTPASQMEQESFIENKTENSNESNDSKEIIQPEPESIEQIYNIIIGNPESEDGQKDLKVNITYDENKPFSQLVEEISEYSKASDKAKLEKNNEQSDVITQDSDTNKTDYFEVTIITENVSESESEEKQNKLEDDPRNDNKDNIDQVDSSLKKEITDKMDVTEQQQVKTLNMESSLEKMQTKVNAILNETATETTDNLKATQDKLQLNDTIKTEETIKAPEIVETRKIVVNEENNEVGNKEDIKHKTSEEIVEINAMEEVEDVAEENVKMFAKEKVKILRNQEVKSEGSEETKFITNNKAQIVPKKEDNPIEQHVEIAEPKNIADKEPLTVTTKIKQETQKLDELKYFTENEKSTAQTQLEQFSKFLKKYTEITQKIYLINCDTYEENIFKEVSTNFGEFEIVNYFKNGHLKLPNSTKNIVKNIPLSSEVTLPIENTNFSQKSPIFSPSKSECSFELSSDYDAKLDEIVNKKSRQEVMEIILGGIIDDPAKNIQDNTEISNNIENTEVKSVENTEICMKNKFKRKNEVESTSHNNRSVLTPTKVRKMSESDQISSTTEESEDQVSNNNKVQIATRSKYLGKAKRVGLPRPKRCNIVNSPSSDKSVENYSQNQISTPVNGKMKQTPRSKVQRYDTSDLYKPKLHYLSRRNNIS